VIGFVLLVISIIMLVIHDVKLERCQSRTCAMVLCHQSTDLCVVDLVCRHFVDLDVFNKGDAPLLKTRGNNSQILTPSLCLFRHRAKHWQQSMETIVPKVKKSMAHRRWIAA